MTRSKALRQSEQRAYRKRFEIHDLAVLDDLGSDDARQSDLYCRIECMSLLLDRIIITNETAKYRETLVELKARVADRGKPVRNWPKPKLVVN